MLVEGCSPSSFYILQFTFYIPLLLPLHYIHDPNSKPMVRSLIPWTLCALLFILTHIAVGQFPVVNTHDQKLGVLGSLSSGWYYLGPEALNTGSRTIYNLDMSVFRVLNYPAPPVGMQWMNMCYITDALFDTDPTTIEFMMQAYHSGGTNPGIFVFREDGTELFSQVPANYGIGNTAVQAYGPIYMVNGIAYLALNQHISAGPTTIYQLPGQLACHDCFGSPGTPDAGMGLQGGGAGLSPVTLFPNPASTTLTVVRPTEYRMYRSLEIFDAAGRLAKTLPLSAGEADVLQVGDLPAGHYQCQLVHGDVRYPCGALLIER
jgi:hypothetical protein